VAALWKQGADFSTPRLLPGVETAPELVGDLQTELLWGMTGHLPELFREVGLIVVVVVEIILERIERLALRPLSIEFLEAEYSGEHLRGEADVLLEKHI
jgi:hypothetical protein